MANKKKTNSTGIELRILAILLSIILVPGLIAAIPVGGAAIAISSAISQEEVTILLQEQNVSEMIRRMVLEEVTKEENNIAEKLDDLNPEYLNKVLEDVVSAEFADSIVQELVSSSYQGTQPQVDVTPALEQLTGSVQELADHGFDDLYEVWANGTTSKYFSEEVVQEFISGMKKSLRSAYSRFGDKSVEELEQLYDKKNGEGAFKTLLNEKVEEIRSDWEAKFLAEYESKIEGLTGDLESRMNEAVNEATREFEAPKLFGFMQKISALRDSVKQIVYVGLIGMVVLLLVLYWLEAPGFVVTSIPVLLGGLVCKLTGKAKEPLMALVKQKMDIDLDNDVVRMAYDVAGSLFDKVVASVSQFGTYVLILGAGLFVFAIILAVTNKKSA